MANKERADKWLDIVTEDLSVAELLFNNGHWALHRFHVPSSHREDLEGLLVRMPRRRPTLPSRSQEDCPRLRTLHKDERGSVKVPRLHQANEHRGSLSRNQR